MGPRLAVLGSTSREHNATHLLVVLNSSCAAVACGGLDRLEELSVMMKSAVIFSQSKPLKFLIFTDQLGPDIEKILKP